MEEKKDIELTRNQMHERLMICFYQYLLFLSIGEKQDLKTIIDSSFEKNNSKSDPFVRECILYGIKNMPSIVEKITPLLKEGFKFDKLGGIHKAILVLGTTEIMLGNPKPVVINNCVKLAKKYCDDNVYKFINAILEKI